MRQGKGERERDSAVLGLLKSQSPFPVMASSKKATPSHHSLPTSSTHWGPNIHICTYGGHSFSNFHNIEPSKSSITSSKQHHQLGSKYSNTSHLEHERHWAFKSRAIPHGMDQIKLLKVGLRMEPRRALA